MSGRLRADRDIEAPHLLAVPRAETCAGGLLFFVPVLDRLGYAAWLESQPQWSHVDVARRLFSLVLARLDVDAMDPAWQVARWTGARAPRRFVAPAVWRQGLCDQGSRLRLVEDPDLTTLWDPSGRLLLGAWRGPCPRALLRAQREAISTGSAPAGPATGVDTAKLDPATFDAGQLDLAGLVATAWLVAARRWLRRHARVGIATLVRRPASISVTPTHVDLAFELADVDIRIRRAGLDIDPGWVPWLGRVVTFHYRDADGSAPT
jgi:hypothetical protein